MQFTFTSLEKVPSIIDSLEMGKEDLICILPLPRIYIEKHEEWCGFHFFPSGDNEISEILSEFHSEDKDQIVEEFTSQTLLFVKHTVQDHLYSGQHHGELLQEISERVKPMLDLIRFIFCRYDRGHSLPGYPGQISNGRAGLILFSLKYNWAIARIIDDFFSHEITKGHGLTIECLAILRTYDIFGGTLGEVGNIAKHALSLNSMTLETNSLTSKFVLTMSLLEYIANPDSYQKFQEVKKEIAAHCTDNNNGYLALLTRFNELTGKKTKDECGVIQYEGIRTRLVHLGQRLEDVVDDSESAIKIMNEIQRYSYQAIESMLLHSHMDWSDFIEHRKMLREQIIQNNSQEMGTQRSREQSLLLI